MNSGDRWFNELRSNFHFWTQEIFIQERLYLTQNQESMKFWSKMMSNPPSACETKTLLSSVRLKFGWFANFKQDLKENILSNDRRIQDCKSSKEIVNWAKKKCYPNLKSNLMMRIGNKPEKWLLATLLWKFWP